MATLTADRQGPTGGLLESRPRVRAVSCRGRLRCALRVVHLSGFHAGVWLGAVIVVIGAAVVLLPRVAQPGLVAPRRPIRGGGLLLSAGFVVALAVTHHLVAGMAVAIAALAAGGAVAARAGGGWVALVVCSLPGAVLLITVAGLKDTAS